MKPKAEQKERGDTHGTHVIDIHGQMERKRELRKPRTDGTEGLLGERRQGERGPSLTSLLARKRA
jgi:hypothetical protein